MKKTFVFLTLLLAIAGCNKKHADFDASGSFEADEIIVSAQQSGQILRLNIQEGSSLEANEVVGQIDISNLKLQKEQAAARITAMDEKLNSAAPQVAVIEKQLKVIESQINYLRNEKNRTEKLLKADAATPKQLDEITAKLEEALRQQNVYRQQIQQSVANVQIQNRSVLSEKTPLQKSVAQIEDQINKATIINPIKGTVLLQFAFPGEITNVGKPLYKIANIDTITLRAYISGQQLPLIKLNQSVTIRCDDGNGDYKKYTGLLTWISDKAEFTPKTIQTKDERQNLVYAIKIKVVNDGYLKIGMYGEAIFNSKATDL